MKAVVYCATRNIYRRLLPSINSLFKNNKGIDKVYCFLEDDNFPPFKDERIEVINYKRVVHYIDENSPNCRTQFTYMAMIRLALAKYFPNLDRVLYLDVDTIVDKNIEQLWEIDIADKAIVGVAEWMEQHRVEISDSYLNAGVSFYNLDYLREKHLDDKLIEMANGKVLYQYPDQDIMNLVLDGHKITVPSEYNDNFATGYTQSPKIVHFAGVNEWWRTDKPRNEYYQKYKCESI